MNPQVHVLLALPIHNSIIHPLPRRVLRKLFPLTMLLGLLLPLLRLYPVLQGYLSEQTDLVNSYLHHAWIAVPRSLWLGYYCFVRQPRPGCSNIISGYLLPVHVFYRRCFCFFNPLRCRTEMFHRVFHGFRP